MKRIKAKRGLNIPLHGAIKDSIISSKDLLEPKFVGILAEDYFGLKPRFVVSEGDNVRVGDPIFEDKTNEGFYVTSQVSGKIHAINRGDKRALISVIIENDKTYKSVELRLSGVFKEDIISAGLWDSFRERPYERVPRIGTEPDYIFVNGCKKDVLEICPSKILSLEIKNFNRGLAALEELANKKVYITLNELVDLQTNNSEVVLVEGKQPSGSSSFHIQEIKPLRKSEKTWTIDSQDVIRLGNFLSTNKHSFQRFVSITGPACYEPKVVRTLFGGSLEELTAGNVHENSRLISGNAIYGTSGDSYVNFLSRYTNQISIISDKADSTLFNWLKLGQQDHSVTNVFLSSMLKPKEFHFDTNINGGYRAVVPIGVFDEINPFNIDPTLLLKSLAIGDLVALRELGIFDLTSEDMGIFSYVCPSKYDYVALFNDCIEEIWKEESS